MTKIRDLFFTAKADIRLAAVFLIIGSFSLLPAIIFLDSLLIIQASLTIILASGTYLLLQWRRGNSSTTDDKETAIIPHNIDQILDIVFWLLLTAMILILYRDVYSRPLSFLIIVSVMSAILAIQILSDNHTGYSLIKIIIIGVLLRASAFYQFPGLAGYDTVAEITLSEQLTSTGFIGGYMGAYQYYPLAHILTASISQITGFNITNSFFMLGLIEVISLVFIFLIGKYLFNDKTGLIAVLVLSVFDWHILWGFYIKAMTFGIALIPIVIFLILAAKDEKKLIYTSLSILMLFLVILTHTFVTAVLLVILLFGWLISIAIKRRCHDRDLVSDYEHPIRLDIVLLLGFTTIAYWLYVSGFYTYVAYAVNYALSIDNTITGTPTSQLSVLDTTWARLPVFTLIFFAIIGCLSIFNFHKLTSKTLAQIWLALLCGVMVVISFAIFSISNLETLIRERWFVFVGLIAAIPVAKGLLSMVGNRRHQSAISMAIIIFLFSGIMTTSYIANVSSVTSWGASRYMASSASELAAAETVSRITALDSSNTEDSVIYADHYFSQIFRYEYDVPSENIVDFSEILKEELANYQGILMLREAMLDIVSTNDELIMDQTQYQALLGNSNISLIYDNGTTKALLQS